MKPRSPAFKALDRSASFAFLGAMCLDVLYNDWNIPDPSIRYNSPEAVFWCFAGLACAIGLILEVAGWMAGAHRDVQESTQTGEKGENF